MLPRRAGASRKGLSLGLALVMATLTVASATCSGAATLAPAIAPLRLDPTVDVPWEPLAPEVAQQVEEILTLQETALGATDLVSYTALFAPLPVPPEPFPSGVIGDPRDRVRRCLFGAMGDGAVVEQVDISTVFIVPGSGNTLDVLARHAIGYRTLAGERRFLLVSALERLRPAPDPQPESPVWQVFDWFVVDEETARLSWPVWLTGSVTLEPLDSRLRAEVTYALFPGFPRAGGRLDFELATTFEVSSVRGEAGDLPWERNGETISVTLPARPEPGKIVSLTFSYSGYVTPGGTARRGKLEYLGVDGIYLRPDTGWYPQPEDDDFVRGTLTVTVPSWWAAAAPGRLIAAPPVGKADESRTFTWGLDTPAELYLAAGPYLVAERITATGVTVRSFFYAREAKWSDVCLAEAERILAFFSDLMGGYPYPNLTLAEAQDFYYGGVSARSFVLLEKTWLSNPEWDTGTRSLLAHELSHQWWGEVIPIRREPEWFLWEGLASYSEALYAEACGGPAALAAEMRAKAASYAQATRFRVASSIAESNAREFDWQETIVYDKGAWVFHTLRFLLGEEEFAGLLRSYLTTFVGRQPTTADLGLLVAEARRDDPYLPGFVELWASQPGEPDLALSHVSLARREDVYVLSFTLRDRGGLGFPRAEVRVSLGGGRTQTVTALCGENKLEFSEPPTALVSDPDGKVLDLHRLNNRYYLWLGLPLPGVVVPVAAGALAAAGAVILFAAWRRRVAARRVDAPQR